MDVDVGQQDWSTVLQVSDLPSPPNWQNDSVAMLLGAALFAASGVASAFVMVRAVASGDLLTALISLGSVIFCLCITVAIVRIKYVAAPIRVCSGADGTTLRPDRAILILIFTALAAVVPSGILYCIYVPRGEVNISLSPGERVFSPYLVGILVLLGVWGLASLAIRREAGHFALSPDGYEIASLGVKPVRGAWDDVAEIKDIDKKARHPVVFVRHGGPVDVLKNASGFAPNGLAYWMTRHYFEHPDDRMELADGRAVERLRGGRFSVS